MQKDQKTKGFGYALLVTLSVEALVIPIGTTLAAYWIMKRFHLNWSVLIGGAILGLGVTFWRIVRYSKKL